MIMVAAKLATYIFPFVGIVCFILSIALLILNRRRTATLLSAATLLLIFLALYIDSLYAAG